MSEIRNLTTKMELQERKQLLENNCLRETEANYIIGIFEMDKLLATGSIKDNVIQTVAVEKERQGEGLMNIIITELYTYGRNKGYEDIFIFSKTENEKIFKSCGFTTVSKTDKWIFLESDKNGLKKWVDKYKYLSKDENSCIVMNANPFTLGHHYLVEKALEKLKINSKLIVFVVEQDSSFFDFKTRFELVNLGLSDINQKKQIIIIPSGPYVLSMATFPTYFTKDKEEAKFACSQLDINLFAQKIAPELNIKQRFVGTEENDITTACYNRNLFSSINYLVQIPRLELSGTPISASWVRKFYNENNFQDMKKLVPTLNYQYLVSKRISSLAGKSLIEEVLLTPKPGLVDQNNNGSHHDMDIDLFFKSSKAIEPFLFKIAQLSFTLDPLKNKNSLNSEIRKIGIECEKAMFEATFGINTHKGAIFSFSLFIYAIVQLIQEQSVLSALSIGNRIKLISTDFDKEFKNYNSSSKGQLAYKKYKIKGVRGEAQIGYDHVIKAFTFFKTLLKTHSYNSSLCWTLIWLIANLDDTNIITRKDLQTQKWAQAEGEKVLKTKAFENLEIIKDLDKKFIEKNISPGGSADLLALTIFLYKLSCK
ncbi:MAG: triphosphoribosyl-dephospho-CoA synthase [Sphaerochaetaceae bacterium]